MEKKNILLSQQSSTSPERTKINILFDSSSRFRSWRLLNASSSSLPPSLPNSSAILLSLAFSFAPNLRPIIAAEEAISNLNESPSRSVPPSSFLASPRLAIDRIHHRLRSSSPVGRPRNFFSRDDRMPTRNSLLLTEGGILRNFDPVHATQCSLLFHPHIRVLSFYFREYFVGFGCENCKNRRFEFKDIFERLKIVNQFFLVHIYILFEKV